MTFINKFIYLCALLSFSAAASAVGRIADVTIYDRVEDRVLPIYHHAGRHYVVGKPGNEYQVRVRNRTGREILSVISVDGVNAVSGETANWDQTGYVFGARQSFDIRGWRKSMDRIAAFYFTEHQHSYAARTGRPNNVGVIGVAMFRKKYKRPVRIDPRPRSWPHRESPFPSSGDDVRGSVMGGTRAEDSVSSAPSARSAPAEVQLEAEAPEGVARDLASGSTELSQVPRKSTTLGTGHGRSEVSEVTYTEFERATSGPAEVITIHYNTRENLVRLGVIRPPAYALPVPQPMPFPGQFAADPY
jgi:hypothetical protein